MATIDETKHPGKSIAFIACTVQWAKLLTLEEFARACRDRYPEGSFGWYMELPNLDIVENTKKEAREIFESNGFDAEEIHEEAIKLREELSIRGLLSRSALPDNAKAELALQSGLPPCL